MSADGDATTSAISVNGARTRPADPLPAPSYRSRRGGAGARNARRSYGRAFAAAVPGAKFVTIADAGYFPHIEQPQTFAAHVFAFSDAGRRASDDAG
jgi:pimeloyl-ACP methyl ester carboxylesterase